jgi:hypothetical protein
MTIPSLFQLLIEGVMALATVAVAVLAIWGNWIRSKLAPPKMTIRAHTPEGDPVPVKEGLRFYYHLKVVNERPWLPVVDCRVVLKRLTKRGPNGEFAPVRLAVPLQFVWSPSGVTPPTVTFAKEHVLDFGFMAQGRKFTPSLYSYLNNFEGYVGANEAVRFHLAIEATNFVSDKYFVFEVAWDGKWSEEREAMARHLVITDRSLGAQA